MARLPVALLLLFFLPRVLVGQEEPVLITFLNVGQGDAVLIQSPEGQTALIDAGPGVDIVSILRDHGIDIPDPQFGVDGGFFGGGQDVAGIDFLSRDFLDATEACQHLLQALQPELDQAQQAEQNEQLLVFAECMRREGIDFPDPDPIRGLSIGTMRGDDGELRFDPFAPDFQAASTVCAAEVGVETPGAPGS